MAVSRDHLRRERVRFEAESLAGDPLNLRLYLCVRADRARELADAVCLDGSSDTRARAVQLERPAGELPAERRRLGMNSVRSTGADCVPVLFGARRNRGEGGVARALISRTSSIGTAPSSAQPSSAASSTSSHRASLLCSDQILAMPGRE